MKHAAKITCEVCGDMVAIKPVLSYNTTKSYTTFRHIKKRIGCDDIHGTIHICDKCFLRLCKVIKEQVNG